MVTSPRHSARKLCIASVYCKLLSWPVQVSIFRAKEGVLVQVLCSGESVPPNDGVVRVG